jgi:fructokinase
LIDITRKNVQRLINGYVQSAEVLERIDEYIQLPSLGNRSGALGALAMAIQLTDTK